MTSSGSRLFECPARSPMAPVHWRRYQYHHKSHDLGVELAELEQIQQHRQLYSYGLDSENILFIVISA